MTIKTFTGTLTAEDGTEYDVTLEATEKGEVPEPPEPEPAPEPGEVVCTFALKNTSSEVTSGVARIGMPFKIGDVPDGSSVRIYFEDAEVPSQFDQVATWPDGSIRFAAVSLRDDDFPPGERRAYDAKIVEAPFDSTSGGDIDDVGPPLLDLTADFVNVHGFVSGPLPEMSASFAAHAERETRVTKLFSGPVVDGWAVWGMAEDSNSGEEHKHLKINWYVWNWKEEDGDHLDFEFLPIVALDWWSVPDPEKLSYDASLYNKGDLIAKYFGVKQPYMSRWGMCNLADDFGHADSHWESGRTKLHYEPDTNYWLETGMVPPFNMEGEVVMPAPSPIYVPGSCQGHRKNIDGTGGYPGRGILDNFSSIAFINPTPENIRAARLQSWAGVHIPYHYRSNDLRTRPEDDSDDIANTLMCLIMEDERGKDTPPEEYTFIDLGLPAPYHAYADPRTPIADQGGYVTLFPPKDPVTGITPPPRTDWVTQDTAWAPSGNDSHSTNFCYFMYLWEAAPWFLDALYSHAVHGIQASVGGIYGGKPQIRSVGIYPNVPTTTWSGIGVAYGTNERGIGWHLNNSSAASSVAPDKDPHSAYLRKLTKHQFRYLLASLSYVPDTGRGFWSPGAQIQSPWMYNINGQCARAAIDRLDYNEGLPFADYCLLVTLDHWRSHQGHSHTYHAAPKASGLTWSPTLDLAASKGGDWRETVYEVLEGATIVGAPRGAVGATDKPEAPPGQGDKPDKPGKPPTEPEVPPTEPNGQTIPADVDRIYLAAPRKMEWREGDSVFPYDFKASGKWPVPEELQIGKYYTVTDPDGGASFKLKDEDGNIVQFQRSYGTSDIPIFAVRLEHSNTADQEPDGYVANADSYSAISAAHLIYAYVQGNPDVTLLLVQRAMDFHARTNIKSWRTWAFAPME